MFIELEKELLTEDSSKKYMELRNRKVARNIDGGSTGGFGVSVLTSDGQVGGSGTSGGGGSSGGAGDGCTALKTSIDAERHIAVKA
ncbi:MAG: hypothetical protein M3Q07_23040 [Pseudobdellovibrionaceae bacterium]|nr:hypothetical protein [Pseudobdellovibrionaceae bacterium]